MFVQKFAVVLKKVQFTMIGNSALIILFRNFRKIKYLFSI